MDGRNSDFTCDDVSFSMAARSTVSKTFRIPLDVIEPLEARAALNNQSLNAFLVQVLERELEREPTLRAEELLRLAQARPSATPSPVSGKAFAQFLIPPATPLSSPNPSWDAVGYLRMKQDLVIDLHDDAAEQILGPLKDASLAQFKGIGTYDPVWEEMLACVKVGQPFDSQLVLCHPSDPSSPVFVGLAFLFEAPYYFVRINKVWENGQWVRKRTIRLDLPERIKP